MKHTISLGRKTAALAACFLLLLLTVSCGGDKGQTTDVSLSNGSFEQVTDGLPADWTLTCYDSSKSTAGSGAVVDPSAPDGQYVLAVVSEAQNDTRFVQTVHLDKGAYYRFSAKIKTVGVTGQKEDGGAGLSVLGTFFTSKQVSGTADWTEVTVYGKAAESGNFDLALRLGYYGNDQQGTAYFDSVSFEKVDKSAIPQGVSTGSIERYQSGTSSDKDEATSNADVTVPVFLRGLLYLVCMAVLLWKGREWLDKMPQWGFTTLLAVALAIRLVSSVVYRGFSVDVVDFGLWGKRMAEHGLMNFYEADYFCDYPPLYMLVLGFLHRIASLFGTVLYEGGGLLLLKLPAILCDMVTAWLIYRLADKYLNRNWAYVLGVLYAFQPAAIVNSALWGQVDSILVLLLLTAFVLLDKDRYGAALAVYFVALYTKPQALLFGPVMLFATVCEFLRIGDDFRHERNEQGKRRLLWGFGALFAGIALFLLFSLVMANGQPFIWLWDKYVSTVSSYPYAAVNVFSIMSLLGGQWTPADSTVFLGITYAQLGTFFTVLLLLYGALLMGLHLRRTKGKVETASLWLYASLIMMGAVVLSTRSHERYLFPAIAFLLVAFIRTGDKRLLYSSVAAGTLSYLNIAAVLYLYERNTQYMTNGNALLIIGSLGVVILFVYVAVIAWNHAVGSYKQSSPVMALSAKGKDGKGKSVTYAKNGGKNTSVTAGNKLEPLLTAKSFSLPKVSWKDVVLCLLLTLSYAAVALWDLGDTTAPQTFWQGETSAVYTTADFGTSVTADRLLYRPTEKQAGSVKVEVSKDGETYTVLGRFTWDDTKTSNWYEADLTASATFRYLRITPLTADTNLHEVALLKGIEPVKPVSFTDNFSPADTLSAKGESLFDCTDSLPAEDFTAKLPKDGLAPGKTETTDALWQVGTLGDYALVDFGEVTAIQRGYFYPGLIPNGIELGVRYSSDGVTWTAPATVTQEKGKLYYWHGLPSDHNTYPSLSARYVLLEVRTPGARLLEVGFYASADSMSVIPVASVTGRDEAATKRVSAAFDEQTMVPLAPSYRNSMYFDEIYHARTGYESANGLAIYEVSHPPLGKDFIAMSIQTLGMTPFAWRLPGVMAGILMLPVLYFLGLFIFRKRVWATGLTLLMTLDGMHLAQTRIATIDSFALLFILLMFLFMFWYQSISFYDRPLWKTFVPLGLCGLSFGLGVASKWIGVYAGAGLAVIFFITVYRRTKEYQLAKSRVLGAKGETKEYLQHIVKVYRKNLWATLLFCVAFFVVIPLVIYALSYIPYYRAEGETRSWFTVLTENQSYMFRYHSTLKATHPYQSDWYSWPVIYKPMWFYKGQELPAGMSACISSFGNPAVWYTGLVCTVTGIWLFVKRLVQKNTVVRYAGIPLERQTAFEQFFAPGDGDVADSGLRDKRTVLFLLIGIACNLGPWMGIGRCVFIYHYFATTPFIMLFTVWCLRELSRKKPKLGGIVLIALLVVSLVLFIMFRPVWTGATVSTDYIRDYLKWFKTWEFGVG